MSHVNPITKVANLLAASCWLFLFGLFTSSDPAFAQKIDLFPCQKDSLTREASFGSADKLKEKVREFRKSTASSQFEIDNRLMLLLRCAASYENQDTFFALLDEGVSIHSLGISLVGRSAIINELLNRKLYLQHLLVIASHVGDVDLAQRAIEAGAQVNLNDKGILALGKAVSNGHIGIIKLLLEKGADINLTAGHGGSALWYACLRDRIEIAKLLLEKGAQINQQNANSNDEAAIHQARSSSMVKLLAEHGAEIDIKDRRGRTALMNAVKAHDLPLVESLIAAGANPNLKDKELRSAIQLSPSQKIAEALRGSTSISLQSLDEAQRTDLIQSIHLTTSRSECPEREVLEKFLRTSAVNHQDIFGMTALHYATIRECDQAAQFLLDNGADIKLQDNIGRTPLDAGRARGMYEHFEALLTKRGALSKVSPSFNFSKDCEHALPASKNGANINQVDSFGNNCVLLLVAKHGVSRKSLREWLEGGANPLQKNCKGISAVKWISLNQRYMKFVSRQVEEWIAGMAAEFAERGIDLDKAS